MTLASWGPNEWTALGTVVTGVVAVAAALVALFHLREVKETRREQTQPYVVVDFVPSRVGHNVLNIAVVNIGSTPARDVRITFATDQDEFEGLRHRLDSTIQRTDPLDASRKARRSAF
jgi:hypothetical protein